MNLASGETRTSRTVTAEEAGSGLRLDKWLATWPEISSRSRAAQLIDESRVRVNDKIARASLVVRAGDLVVVVFPAPSSSELIPSDLPLEVLFEDSDVIVVNKPSGLVVHPAAGHAQDTLVNALLGHTDDLAMGFGEKRPGIVHRLDKETSGLLVVAKNDRAQEALVRQFQARTIHRIYQAVVFGEMREDHGVSKSWLLRHPIDRKRFASVLDAKGKIDRAVDSAPRAGKWAVTHHQVLARARGLSFVQLKLETGRTHQIRVHLSEMNHPLVGDTLYGADRRLKNIASPALREEIRALPRFMLHARELGFVHPTDGRELRFERDWPDEDRAHLRTWGFE